MFLARVGEHSARELAVHVGQRIPLVPPIDYQTMFWGLEHSPEPREGMTAFMEKRPPNWIPDDMQ